MDADRRRWKTRNQLCGTPLLSLYIILIAAAWCHGKQIDNETDVKSIRDLFNTTSCVDPPFVCPHKRIQIYLYTRYTQSTPELLDTSDNESLYKSYFNPNHPTKVLVHGFQGGRNFSPSTDLRQAYFKRGNYNIIVVDYSTLVRLPCLSQVQWSPGFCAQCIAQMVWYLAQHPRGVQPETLHFIGYSIGAHIAGLTANYLQGAKLGRITGLDPTIIFYMGNNRTQDLDPSDALFVDVIHTGAGILGQWGPNGHADFYVNGGTSQPGCLDFSIIKTLSCDHTKVSPYFIESINSKSGFWAVACPNRVAYNLGFCTPTNDNEYVLMGEHVPHSFLFLKNMFRRLNAIFSLSTTLLYRDHPQSLRLKMASKRRNMFHKNKKQETTENV